MARAKLPYSVEAKSDTSRSEPRRYLAIYCLRPASDIHSNVDSKNNWMEIAAIFLDSQSEHK